MAKGSAGKISITLSAGTAQFIADMDRANVKVRDFGAAQHGLVSSTQAASGAIRLLEGNFQNNIRAVERFIATTLGAGDALKAVFPIVGAAASLGILAKLSEEAYNFFRTIKDAPEKAKGEFGQLNAALHTTNDELLLANAKLDNQIAKLEGHRQNTLKVTLDEARVAADHLAESLEKDIQSLSKLLKENEVGTVRQLFGEAGTKDISRESGGRTGFGGFAGDIAKLREDSNRAFDAASTKGEKEAAQAQLQISLTQRYREELEKVNREIKAGPGLSVSGSIANALQGRIGLAANDDSVRAEVLTQRRRFLEDSLKRIPLEFAKEAKTEKVSDLEANRSNEAIDKPFRDRINKIKAEIEAVRSSLAAVGKDQEGQILAKSYSAAVLAIEEVNKAMERNHVQLTVGQKSQIQSVELTKANLEADKQWKEQQQSLATASAIRISSLYALTAAIGKGYEATREANIETKINQELGEKANDQKFLEKNAGALALRRNDLRNEANANNANQIATATDRIGDQIEAEKNLAAVQKDGAEASRLLALAYRLREITMKGGYEATKAQIAAEIELYNAQRANLSAEQLAQLSLQEQAIRRITDAETQGAEAVRKANLENRYAALANSGASPEVINAERKVDQLKHEQDITSEAFKRVNVYKDQLGQIDQQIGKLQEIQAAGKGTLDTSRALRELEDQKLHTLAQQALSMGSARDGVRAFFLEMQTQAVKTSEIVYTALNSAVDRVSENLAKAFTGQKTNFGQAFKDIAQEYLQSSIKQQLQGVIGRVGQLLGISGLAGKADGSSADKALWVKLAGAGLYGSGPTGIGGSGGGGLSGIAGKLGGILSGNAGGLLIKNFAGDGGAPIASGGRGGDTYNIDARGSTDPMLTVQRVTQALKATRESSIADSVLAFADRSFRVPSGSL